MENAQLPLAAPVMAGETIPVRNNGLTKLQVREEEIIGSAQAVLESVHARALFAVGSFGHDVKLIEFRLQVTFNKGHKSLPNVVDAIQMYD